MAFLSYSRAACAPVPARRITFLDLVALRRQRLGLARLSDAALSDLGLSPRAAQAEARRGFFDIPAHWQG